MTRRRDDAGQTAVLIVGFFVVAALLVAVAVDASAAYLRRQGLGALADAAALAAADGIQSEQVYRGGLGDRARLDPAAAHAYAAAHIRASGAAAAYPGLAWSVQTSADRVVVRVWAPLELPIEVPGVEQRPVISSTAAAYVLVSE